MSLSRITFLPYQRSIEVSEGDSLIRTALQAGVHINASCGGEGVCAKCRVQVEQGEVSEGLSERLSPEDIEAGYRLACQARIKGDATIRVPTEEDDQNMYFSDITWNDCCF